MGQWVTNDQAPIVESPATSRHQFANRNTSRKPNNKTQQTCCFEAYGLAIPEIIAAIHLSA
jgi:hypothetical protein